MGILLGYSYIDNQDSHPPKNTFNYYFLRQSLDRLSPRYIFNMMFILKIYISVKKKKISTQGRVEYLFSQSYRM